MSQMSLKLKTYARNVSNAGIINNNLERFSLQAILCSFGVLTAWYILLLGSMVFNIVERRALETSARALGSEVADLELIYLSMSNNIDLALSHSMGFQEVKANFATRKSFSSLGTIKLVKNEI